MGISEVVGVVVVVKVVDGRRVGFVGAFPVAFKRFVP